MHANTTHNRWSPLVKLLAAVSTVLLAGCSELGPREKVFADVAALPSTLSANCQPSASYLGALAVKFDPTYNPATYREIRNVIASLEHSSAFVGRQEPFIRRGDCGPECLYEVGTSGVTEEYAPTRALAVYIERTTDTPKICPATIPSNGAIIGRIRLADSSVTEGDAKFNVANRPKRPMQQGAQTESWHYFVVQPLEDAGHTELHAQWHLVAFFAEEGLYRTVRRGTFSVCGPPSPPSPTLNPTFQTCAHGHAGFAHADALAAALQIPPDTIRSRFVNLDTLYMRTVLAPRIDSMIAEQPRRLALHANVNALTQYAFNHPDAPAWFPCALGCCTADVP